MAIEYRTVIVAGSSNVDVAVNTAMTNIVQHVPPGVPRVIPEEQSYFWTYEWQLGERAADEDRARGEVRRFETVDDAIRGLLSDD